MLASSYFIAINPNSLIAVYALEPPLLLLRSAVIELECRMQNGFAVIGLEKPSLNCVCHYVAGNAVHELEAPLSLWNLPLLS